MILKRLNGVFSRSLKRGSCSALLICSQNLHDDRAGVGQLLLELVDLVVGAHPVGRRAIAFDALDQHAAVPRAVEDRDAAARRDVAPEAPEVRMRALFVGRRGDRAR